MATIVWKPAAAREEAVVTIGGSQYTFVPGVPKYVPQEHYAAAQTALLALPAGGTAAAGPVDG